MPWTNLAVTVRPPSPRAALSSNSLLSEEGGMASSGRGRRLRIDSHMRACVEKLYDNPASPLLYFFRYPGLGRRKGPGKLLGRHQIQS